MVSLKLDQNDSQIKDVQLYVSTQWPIPSYLGANDSVSVLPGSVLPPAFQTFVKSQPEIGQIERSKSKMRFTYNLLAAVMRWSCDGNGVGTDWLAMKFGDVPWTSGIQLKVDSPWLMIYSVMKKVSLLLLFFMSPNYYIVLSSVEWRISSIVFHVTPELLILLSGSLRKETFKVFMWYLFSSPSPPKK